MRLVTESPWHALFAQTLFRVPSDAELEGFGPQALILHAPGFTADGPADGVRQDNFVSLHLTDLEIDGIARRCDRLLSRGSMPAPRGQWRAVPWPPF